MASKLFLLLAACLAGGWYGTLEEQRVVEAPVSLDPECLSPGGAGSAHSRHRRVWALVHGTPCRHPALLAIRIPLLSAAP